MIFLVIPGFIALLITFLCLLDLASGKPYVIVDKLISWISEICKLPLTIYRLRKWETQPIWGIEYFAQGYYYISGQGVTPAKWQWVNWTKTRFHDYGPSYDETVVFHSESKAINGFKKTSIYKRAPYTEFRTTLVKEGVSKFQHKNKELEKERQARIEYREKYTEHLEAELVKMRSDDN